MKNFLKNKKKTQLSFPFTMKRWKGVMCDVIKIRLKISIITRSGRENQPLNIKTAVERPIFKLGLPKF